MAQQDVRYYLNGMLWELEGKASCGWWLLTVTGWPCATCRRNSRWISGRGRGAQVILPRKGVLELEPLLLDDEAEVSIVIGSNHIRAMTEDFTFTSKLVDGKFPDYKRVLPRTADKSVHGLDAWSCARPLPAPPSCPTRSIGACA